MLTLETTLIWALAVTLFMAAFGVGHMAFVVVLNLLVVFALALRLFYDHAVAPLWRRIGELEARNDGR